MTETRRLVVETIVVGEEFTTGRLYFLENDDIPIGSGMGLMVEENHLWQEFILILQLGCKKAGVKCQHILLNG